MIYDRGDVVILPFPFITTDGVQQKARPALAKTSVVRCEYLMTVPVEIIVRKLGKLSEKDMHEIDHILRISLGLR